MVIVSRLQPRRTISRLIQHAALPMMLLLGPPTLAITQDGPAAEQTAAPQNQNGDTSWPLYNMAWESRRYVELDGINNRNVGGLKEQCRIAVDEAGSFQSGLLLAEGRLYANTRLATVAVDPTNCLVLWKSVYAPEDKEVQPTNRGSAYANGRLFRGTVDCRVLALDAATGATLWKVKPCDPTGGEWFSSAPIVWNDLVFIGIAGGDWGVQGRLFALDAKTGREVWHFHTIPQGGEFGADTWKAGSAQTGGGGMWSTYTLDPTSGELFVSVGNAAPDFDIQARTGKNLFTDSLVVLDARTGALKWWYQVEERDDHDLDLGAAAMLFDLSDGRPAVAVAGKNGYLYVIDRRSHKLLYKTAVTTILNSGPISLQGTKTCPGIVGGVEWNGPALDRLNRAIVVGSVDWCSLVTKSPNLEHKRGELFLGGTFKMLPDPPPTGWVTSVDQDSGHVRWRFHADAPVISGIVPTAGGLIFFGDMSGNFYALDSADGTVRFKTNTGGAMAGGVISYRLGQRQYVAATSGNISRFSWGESGLPHIVIYRQDVPTSVGPTAELPSPDAASPPLSSAPGAANQGEAVFNRLCASCHGASGEGLTGPTLKGIGHRLSTGEIAAWIMNPIVPPGSSSGLVMPRLYPSSLTERELLDVAAYVGKF